MNLWKIIYTRPSISSSFSYHSGPWMHWQPSSTLETPNKRKSCDALEHPSLSLSLPQVARSGAGCG
jgi:hypothetical protein